MAERLEAGRNVDRTLEQSLTAHILSTSKVGGGEGREEGEGEGEGEGERLENWLKIQNTP